MDAEEPSQPDKSEKQEKLEDRLRGVVRRKGYSIRTERTYAGWYRNFVMYHRLRHPMEMGAMEVSDFLTHLAVERNVAPATQNQALNALVFLYREVLEMPVEGIDALRAKKRETLPVMLTQDETRKLLDAMTGVEALVARVLYGCGLRVMEAMRLRVKDVDLDGRKIEIREAKGGKVRVLTLPESLVEPLRTHLARARTLWECDRRENRNGVHMPFAFDRKDPIADLGVPERIPRLVGLGQANSSLFCA